MDSPFTQTSALRIAVLGALAAVALSPTHLVRGSISAEIKVGLSTARGRPSAATRMKG